MRIAPPLAALPLAALVLTACAGQAPTETAPDDGAGAEGFPVTVTDGRGEVTLEAAPQSIVSLSPTGTEMLFAVGAGEQVAAADEYSNHPEDAPTTELSGFTPNVEAISEYEPDLVVMSEAGDDVLGQLDQLGIPVLVLPAATSLEDTYAQLELLGEATGNAEEGTGAAADLETRIDEIVAGADADTDLTYYHELDPGLYSVTSQTFVGQVYGLFGLTNIADATEDSAGGYPQLSAEFVVDQNPDLIFLTHPGGAQEVAERPAFDTITAVEQDRVVEMDADIASRWGPRVADFAEDVAEAVGAAQGD